ncbi:uncharacterized protein LOC127745463 [Arachis duranensis]|uniref:Uncharacterized protein LOC127745463 n=1 Tax=Arachis duranensis TaxID=130453 RepID=A0A9C6TCQ8_ARADU|nr:uncharacterized protein LOC127745463 [Arachis duranensis]
MSNAENPREVSREGTSEKSFRPFFRVGKFTNYTLLTVLIAEVYQQIAERQLKNMEGVGDKNLYCDYHKDFKHKTWDCLELKDALEQAIREEKLREFSQFIREPRRKERERSEEVPPNNPDTNPMVVVNVVVGRNAPPKLRSTVQKDARVLAVSSGNHKVPPRELPEISFGPGHRWCDELPEDPPMVITMRIGTSLVKRILVEAGADLNIMIQNVFDALGLKEINLKDHRHGVIRLGDNYIKPDGSIILPICVGSGASRKSAMAEFVVLRDSMAYNIILRRRTINELLANIFTKLLTMKFAVDNRSVVLIQEDLEMAVACDNASLILWKRSKEAAGCSWRTSTVRSTSTQGLNHKVTWKNFG